MPRVVHSRRAIFRVGSARPETCITGTEILICFSSTNDAEAVVFICLDILKEIGCVL